MTPWLLGGLHVAREVLAEVWALADEVIDAGHRQEKDNDVTKLKPNETTHSYDLPGKLTVLTVTGQQKELLGLTIRVDDPSDAGGDSVDLEYDGEPLDEVMAVFAEALKAWKRGQR